MDHPNRDTSNLDRRASMRASVALSDDDDYDLSAMLVADGFRPTGYAPPSQAETSYQPQTQPQSQLQSQPQSQQRPQTPTTQYHSTETPTKQSPRMRNRPSSISKPYPNHDSLVLRNDGSSTPAVGQTGLSRVSSMSTDSPVLRIESPYRGPSGPSHPYQMYPQRTMSVATTSTAAAPVTERSYSGPHGPTHPYALYTQNTVTAEEAPEQSIPVGFPGIGNNYQRRIGPDGEEAGDLIGPLGHMEELPPYTRYPDEAHLRKPSPEVPPTELSVPNVPVVGAGGIGLATRDPAFSTDNLGLSRSRPSIRSMSSNSHHEINTAAREIAEKPTMNKWQRRAKKKLWGIVPYWAICMLIIGAMLIGIVMGAVIGTVLSRHKKPRPDPGPAYDVTPTPTTVIVDAQPLTTVPPGLGPLATGWYGLPPLDISQAPKSCFNDTTQAQAWSCEMPHALYSVGVEQVPNESDTEDYQLTLTAVNQTSSKFVWGTQPPNIPDPLPLKLVNDTFEPGRGPAWWLKMAYNKTVILSEDKLDAMTKRSWDSYTTIAEFEQHEPPQFNRKARGAVNGDKPWICTWPETTLEIFIYPDQSISIPPLTAPSSLYPGPTRTTTPGSPSETPNAVYSIPPPPPPAYPKVLKMLERRLSNDADSTAFCRQVIIVDDGQSFKNVLDADGQPIEIVIIENARSWEEQLTQHQRIRYIPRRWHTRDLLARDSLELTDCGCLWWST